jgi:GNAT superfamily N-acetyltransferase
LNNLTSYGLSLPGQNPTDHKLEVKMEAEYAPEFNIRPATQADAAEIAKLSEELGYPTSHNVILDRLQRILSYSEHAVFVVEIPDGPIVGWVHAYLRWLLISGLSVEVGGIVIQEAYRRRGLGKRLLQQIEIWARSQGCKKVSLYSGMQRDIAHLFYPEIGYTRVKSSWKYEKELSRQ